jgi:FMN phosphatase YigB (HAD superfamily)
VRPYRAVLLDFGGTLDAEGVGWKERMRRLYGEAGWAVPPERFDPAFYSADDGLVGALPRRLALTETVDRLVAGIQRGLDLPFDTRAATIARRFASDTLERTRSRIPLLAALGRHHRLGIVANFYGNLEAVCEDAGIRDRFDVLIDSEVVGCSKPDPRIFRAALAALAVEPAEAVFVGDSLARDMSGARAVGMEHVWLAPGGGPHPGTCCAGDRVIAALGDLEEILG